MHNGIRTSFIAYLFAMRMLRILESLELQGYHLSTMGGVKSSRAHKSCHPRAGVSHRWERG